MSSLDSAIRILRCLSPRTPVLKVTEVAERLDMPKSTVSRLMKLLHEGGLLRRDEQAPQYGPGPLGLTLGRLYLARNGLLDQVDKALAAIVERFGFCGFAGVLDGDRVVVVCQRLGWYQLRYVLEVGERLDPRETAMGTALIARRGGGWADDPAAQRFLADRVVEVPCLSVPGITAIGTALCPAGQEAAIGFSISFPDLAAPADTRAEIRTAVLEAARAIAPAIGDDFHLDPAKARPT